MKNFRKLSLVTGLTFALVAALSVGMAFAWQYAKDQTATTVIVNNGEPVREVILHNPPDGMLTTDPVSAIIVDTLRFCAFENLVFTAGDVQCQADPAGGGIGIPILPTDPLEPVIQQFDGAFGPDLIVHFIPDTGLWGDVFPLGTTRACITGLVNNGQPGTNDDAVSNGTTEPLDGDLRFGVIPLCQDLVLIDERRITGGGSVFFPTNGHVRVTRGFELHCDFLNLPNNLQVNVHKNGKQKFHLTALTSAVCTKEDNILAPPPPGTTWNTYVGRGIGRLDGVDGATICFVIRDDGEPGTTDMMAINVWAGAVAENEPGCVAANLDVATSSDPILLPEVAGTVFYVNGKLHNGNFQAHNN